VHLTQIHLCQTLLQDPVCKDVISKGIDSLVVVTNINTQQIKGQDSVQLLRGIGSHHRMQYLPAALEASFSSTWNRFRNRHVQYQAAWGFRDVAYRLALHAVNESLTTTEAATNHTIDILREHWSQGYRSSQELYAARNPLDSAALLSASMKRLEMLQLSSLGALLRLTSLVALEDKPADAIRHLLVAEELLARVASGTQLPALYSLPASSSPPLPAVIAEVLDQVQETIIEQGRNPYLAILYRGWTLFAADGLGCLALGFPTSLMVGSQVVPLQNPTLYVTTTALVFLSIFYLTPLQPPHIRTARRPHSAAFLLYWISWILSYRASAIRPSDPYQAYAGTAPEQICKLTLYLGAARETFPTTLFALCLVEHAAMVFCKVFGTARKHNRPQWLQHRRYLSRVVFICSINIIGSGLLIRLLRLNLPHPSSPKYSDWKGALPLFVLALAPAPLPSDRATFPTSSFWASQLALLCVVSSMDFTFHPDYHRCAQRFALSYPGGSWGPESWYTSWPTLISILQALLLPRLRRWFRVNWVYGEWRGIGRNR